MTPTPDATARTETAETPHKYRVGDPVRVVRNRDTGTAHDHCFQIGTVRHIRALHDDGSGVDLGEWSCGFDEIEPAETAETVTVPRGPLPEGVVTAVVCDYLKMAERDPILREIGPVSLRALWSVLATHFAAAPALSSPQHPVGVREARPAIEIMRELRLIAFKAADEHEDHDGVFGTVFKALLAAVSTLSHPPAQDAPGAVKVKALNDDDFPKEIYVQHPSDADFDGQRWSLHDDFDGQHKAVRYVRADLEPSPPLPKADGEVVAELRKQATTHLTQGDPYKPLFAKAANALVSALRERDEARALAQTFVTIAHTKEVAAFASESAREKAEQVAAGLRERILSPDFIKEVAQEYLSHRGERPWRIHRGGQELWEAHTDAIKSGLVSALRASTEEGKTATPSVKDEEAER